MVGKDETCALGNGGNVNYGTFGWLAVLVTDRQIIIAM